MSSWIKLNHTLYFDDLLLLPLGIWLCLKFIPNEVLAGYRIKAKAQIRAHKPNYMMATFIVILWLLLGYWIYQTWIARID